MDEPLNCAGCAAPLAGGARFCETCGMPAEATTTGVEEEITDGSCAACGQTFADGARFCSSCGAEQPVQRAIGSDPLAPVYDRGQVVDQLAPVDDRGQGLDPSPPVQHREHAPGEKAVTGPKPPRRGAFLALAAAVVVVCGAAGGTASYFIFIKEDRKSGSSSEGTPASPEPGGPAPGSGSGGQSPVEDDWPDSRPGFTVALAAMGGPTGAERMAARGRRGGLDPGVLRSRDYGSLTSDYWFVFHGTFETIEQARRDTARARRAGFRDAYVTYVSREEPVSTNDSSADRAGELRSQRRTGYAVSVPGDWPLVADEVDFGSRLRSKWSHPSKESVSVLVDRTAGADRDVLGSARSIRDDTRGSRGYDEVAFRRITIGERAAVEWHYRLGSSERIDYVVNGCGASYAVLGVAPPGEFSTYAADFREVAESLELTC